MIRCLQFYADDHGSFNAFVVGESFRGLMTFHLREVLSMEERDPWLIIIYVFISNFGWSSFSL